MSVTHPGQVSLFPFTLRSLAPSPPDHAFARVCFGAGALDPRALLLWWPSRLDGRLRRLERGEHRLPRLLAPDQHAQEDRNDEQDDAAACASSFPGAIRPGRGLDPDFFDNPRVREVPRGSPRSRLK